MIPIKIPLSGWLGVAIFCLMLLLPVSFNFGKNIGYDKGHATGVSETRLECSIKVAEANRIAEEKADKLVADIKAKQKRASYEKDKEREEFRKRALEEIDRLKADSVASSSKLCLSPGVVREQQEFYNFRWGGSGNSDSAMLSRSLDDET